jgi:hypothetical protein
MVTFTNQNDVSREAGKTAKDNLIARKSMTIRGSWTPQERAQRAALAEVQTLKLVELLFGNQLVAATCK